MRSMKEIYGLKRRNGRPQDAIGKKRLRELQVAAAEEEKPPERTVVAQALLDVAEESRQWIEGNGGGGVERGGSLGDD